MSDRFKEFSEWEREVIAKGLIQQAKEILKGVSAIDDPDLTTAREILDLAKEADPPKDE